MSIKRPGVEVTQEFVTESVTVVAPSLTPCIVGPCFQIVDAFDDDGELVADALAGTYQDGNGYISYDLPELQTGADVDSDSIRTFLVLGTESTELNAESGEEDITSGTSGTYTWSSGATAVFTASGTAWIDDGVEVGDVVRVTYQGEEYDLVISGTVADESLTVSAEIENASIAFSTYEIVRNPAQFVYQGSVAQASYTFGDETNYLAISALSTGDYAGQAGDGVTIVISETDSIDSGTNGVSGEFLFYTGTDASLTSSVGSVGTVTGFGLYFAAASEGASGESGDAVVTVTTVISDYALGLDDSGIPEGVGSTSQAYRVLQQVGASSTDTTYTVDDDGVVQSFTSTDWSAVDSSLTGADYYVEIDGDSTSGVDGVYHVGAGNGTGQLTLTIAATFTDSAADDGTATLWKVVVDGLAGTDGNSGTLSMFAAHGLSFGSETPSSYDVLITASGGTETGYTAASVSGTSGVVTLTDAVASGADELAWELVDTAPNPNLTWDDDSATVTIRLPRTNGASTSTYAALVASITDDTDSYYDAEVAAVITAAVNGSGTITYADPGSYTLDGGTDADSILVDADLVGSTTPTGKVYTSFTALRVDVSDAADDPVLLSFDNTTDLIASIGPLSADNPLCLGMYFALLNSTSKSVTGLGVGATSTSQPEGTTAAYASALEMLGGQAVYAIAPLTQDPEIVEAVSSHVDAYSAADQKAERICFVSRLFPSYSSATLLASGTAGNTGADFLTSSGDDYCKFSTDHSFADNTDFTDAISAGDTVVLVVSAASSVSHAATLAAGTSTVKYGLTVSDVDSDDGFIVEVTAADAVTTAALDDGDDWEGMVDVTWAVYSLGSALTTTAAVASRVGDFGGMYESRRTFLVWPPEGTATVGGSDISVEGHYFAAGWAGKVGQASPAQGFTNASLSGFSTLKYSNGYFSEAQLDSLAGGGTYIMTQETASSPLRCRHQLSTDVTSIQKRELSITKSIDYVAKIFRLALENKIGKFNITQSFVDALSIQCTGMLRNLVQTGVLNTAQLTSIEVDEDNPDTINLVLLLGVPYPCNYIALTLQI